MAADIDPIFPISDEQRREGESNPLEEDESGLCMVSVVY